MTVHGEREMLPAVSKAEGTKALTRFTEGFNRFVTSTIAPVASGWSGCRVGLAPTGKRRLVTAHTQSGHRLPYQR